MSLSGGMLSGGPAVHLHEGDFQMDQVGAVCSIGWIESYTFSHGDNEH